MNNTVLRTLKEKCSVEKGDKIIVALSGGADSVSLLNILLELSDELGGLTLMAAHVNHRLRGAESDSDEAFVRNLCAQKGVKLFVHTEDVGALSKERGQSIELCARDVRYEFFRKLSDESGAKIATAHTLSDSEETMLFNIARGTSLHGLCSIPFKRGEIIRPLLEVSREEVEAYCAENNLSFVQDSTNFSEDVCKRNKIRLSVLPPLRSVSDGFHQSFRRLREDLINVDDFMQHTALQALEDASCNYGYDAGKLLKLHRAVLDYALALIIEQSGAGCENRHLALCRQVLSQGGSVMLPKGKTAVCTQGIFRIVAAEENCKEAELPFDENVDFSLFGRDFGTEILSCEEIVYRKLTSSSVACDKIDGAVLRTRREGDTFTPLKRGVTKSLRKLQNELKIPAELRSNSLVVAKGSVVLWAEHIGVSALGAVSKDNQNGIYIFKKDVGQNA